MVVRAISQLDVVPHDVCLYASCNCIYTSIQAGCMYGPACRTCDGLILTLVWDGHVLFGNLGIFYPMGLSGQFRWFSVSVVFAFLSRPAQLILPTKSIGPPLFAISNILSAMQDLYEVASTFLVAPFSPSISIP